MNEKRLGEEGGSGGPPLHLGSIARHFAAAVNCFEMCLETAHPAGRL
jgi:hypothetical protein